MIRGWACTSDNPGTYQAKAVCDGVDSTACAAGAEHRARGLQRMSSEGQCSTCKSLRNQFFAFKPDWLWAFPNVAGQLPLYFINDKA